MRTRFPTPIAAVALGWAASPFASAQSITIEMLAHYSQTSTSSPTINGGSPYSFEAHVDSGGTVDLTNWGPGFYRPGTSQTPDSGSPSGFSTTPTGTLNFPSSPNHGTSYFYQANFTSAGAMSGVYTTTGTYGVKFTGTSAPTPTPVETGLTFNSGAGLTFASTVPTVTSLTNGATWNGSGALQVSTSGTTTLNLNTFSQYGAGATYGTLITYNYGTQSGTFVAGSKSIYSTALGVTQSALTSIAIDGTLLTAGQTYTLEIQYGILAGTPGSITLGTGSFTDAAVYYNNTSITFTAIPEPGTFTAIAGAAALLGAGLYRRQSRWRKASP